MKRLLAIIAISLTIAARSGAQVPAIPASSDSGNSTRKSGSAKKQAYPPASLRRDFDENLPLVTGEKLVYEVRYSRFPIYATVGTVTFENLGLLPTVTTATPINGMNTSYTLPTDEKLLHLRAGASSKGILLAILGIGVEDRFENLVRLRDFSTCLSFYDTKEGKKHRVQSGIFDDDENVVRYLTTDPENTSAPPKSKILPRTEGMMSLLTAIYFVRLQKLREGQMMIFPVSYDEENYQFEVLVGKNEKIRTDCGSLKTIRLEPKLFGPGKFFNRQGEMTMWLSNDKKRVPLKLVARTSAGTITARLINFRGDCQIEEEKDAENKEIKDDGTKEKQ